MVQWIGILPVSAGDTGLSPSPEDSWTRNDALWMLQSNYSPGAMTTEAHKPRVCALQQKEATTMRSAHSTTKTTPAHHNERNPSTAVKTHPGQKHIIKKNRTEIYV